MSKKKTNQKRFVFFLCQYQDMSENKALKDQFGQKMVQRIAKSLKTAWPQFNENRFQNSILQDLPSAELIERTWIVCRAMYDQLPTDFGTTALHLKKAMDGYEKAVGQASLDGFYFMPFGNYVSKYGLEHFDLSMDLLNQITRRFTSEFAIRSFLEKYPERTLQQLHEWCMDPDHHVRRLVSEGTRPRLPWAARLRAFQKDPEPVILLLEKLKEDPVLYVRRSVANNLNDIGKDHPERMLSVLKEWARSKNSGTQWIIKHASRSLVKEGNSTALALLGFDPNIKVELLALQVQEEVEMGGGLSFEFVLRSKENVSKKIMVDFVVHYNKANGKQAPKVFKLKNVKIKPSEEMAFKKKISFRSISTRKYYPGKHSIEIQVNGGRLGKKSFKLTIA